MRTADIFDVCNQLVSEGKEPSVALIKARLVRKQPLPALISGLQQWKNNPNKVVEKEPNPEEDLSPTLEQRVESLEQQVVALKQQLEALQTK